MPTVSGAKKLGNAGNQHLFIFQQYFLPFQFQFFKLLDCILSSTTVFYEKKSKTWLLCTALRNTGQNDALCL